MLGRELVNRPDIRIGSKDATESVIIGNMLADLIEAKTDIKVERRLALGGTMIAFEALRSGEIDLYPEYTGTGYSTILKINCAPVLRQKKCIIWLKSRCGVTITLNCSAV